MSAWPHFRALIIALPLIALLLGLAPPVLAQSEADRETARRLASEGFEALQNKDYALAEQRFRRADALVHAPSLVVDHARALVGLGRLVEAHERYELVLREGIAANVPWQWRRAYAEAETELESLKPRLAWLTLRVVGPRRPKVLVDGRPVPRASLGVRRATDPGTHSVMVSSNGYLTQEQYVTLNEGGSAELTIRLERDPSAVVAERRLPQQARTETEYELVQDGSAPDRTLTYITFGLAGAGFAVGAISGGIFLSKQNELLKHCANRVCAPKTQSERSDLRNKVDGYALYGTVSGVALAVGAAGAVTGVTLLLLEGGPDDSSDSARVQAGVSIDGVRVFGRF